VRRAYIDWLRGVAVLCMIEWHVVDAWTTMPARATVFWPVAQWIGGWAAPLFLFLAGVAVPFAIAGHVAKGQDDRRAAWLVARRGWEVFAIAHLFRIQSFLFNIQAPLASLLAPDILNILGLGLAITAWLTGLARRTGLIGRTVWLLVPAIAIVALTPLAPHWQWPAHLFPWLEAYIRPNGLGLFRLFPSVAFVPIGALVGLVMAGAGDEAAERRVHQRLAIAGATIAAMGYGLGELRIAAWLPWTSVWSWPVWQSGMMTLALAAAWALMRAWTTPTADRAWAPILMLGRTSLFVYWVHVELAYGVWSLPLHHRLPLAVSAIGVVGMVVLMYYAAGWWNERTKRPWIARQLTGDS
jgi:hypothetical protein